MALSPRAQRALAFLSQHALPIVWIGLMVFELLPVWNQRLLPMLDTPNHLALARGWHDYNDPTARIAEFYELRVRYVPYWLFYGSIHVLMYVFPIEVANKIFLSLYLVLFPLSALSLTRALGRSPWMALFAFPLAFNQNWIYGFASYLMSVTLSFFSMALLLRYLDTRRLRYALLLCLTTCLCYLSHIMPWFLFGLCAIGVLGVYWHRWRQGLVAGALMVPSVALAVHAVLDERKDHTYIHDAPFSATFHDFPTLVRSFAKRVMELFPGHYDGVVLSLLIATMIGLALAPRIWPKLALTTPLERQRVLKVILWVLGISYISLPYAIMKPISWWYVTPRIPSMMMVYFAMVPAIDIAGWRRVLMIPVIACAIALPVKLAKLYRSFSNRNMPAIRLIEETPRGATTLVVVRNMMRGTGSEEKSGDPATAGPVYWHFSSWPMALRGGYGPHVFNQGIPLRFKKKLTAPGFGTPDSFTFRLAPQFEYYVVRDAPEEMDREPSVKLEHRIGDWSLYHRIHAMTDEP